MPVIAYPDHLPTFLKASKTRRQGASFSAEEVRRGYAYFKKTGPDIPVYWDVTFRFNRFQAIQFWLWFTLKLRRGINEFTIPIDTEGTLSTHRCRFVPDSLLPAQEYGGVWTYTATIESRGVVQGEPAEVPPAPVLFDTFTASNGTDPTSRDMDIYPPGAARWTADNYGNNIVGVIQNNSWTYQPGDGNPGYENQIALQVYSTSPMLTAFPYAIYIHASMPSDPFSSLYVSLGSDVNSSPLTGNFLDVQVGPGNALAFEQFVRGGDFYLADYPSFNVGGEHKYAYWCDGSSWVIAVDGSIVSQGSATVPFFSDLDGITVNTTGENNTTADRALHAIGVYQELSMSEAIALTA